ncbi:hypothetical protein SELMODRAFT_429624 [Selaginella moellendorffii]|uniref:Uncharacterized protein n=1 Tax=Selaginella moellendorffii TaxID=88036 RepID=D8T6S8_SELML|nr:hypothetical protein SELMODRAFT_429624 [Selaginella moellendorffii]
MDHPLLLRCYTSSMLTGKQLHEIVEMAVKRAKRGIQANPASGIATINEFQSRDLAELTELTREVVHLLEQNQSKAVQGKSEDDGFSDCCRSSLSSVVNTMDG